MMLLGATELRKRYTADRIVVECQSFEKLAAGIACLGKLTSKVIAMGNPMNEGTAAEK